MKNALLGITTSITLGIALVMLIVAACPAQSLDADTIVRRANHAAMYQGASSKGKVKLTITDSQGRERKRELNTLRMNVGKGDGPQRYMAYFKSPADVRKMVYLIHKTVEPGQDDARWLYMPSLDMVKRIAAGDKRTSFAGSDFLYEDISGRNPAEDTHEFVGENNGIYVIRNTPVLPDSVEFTHYIAHIDTTTFLPVKVEYFKGETLYRVMETLKVEDIASGSASYPTVTVSRVRNLETGSATDMTFTEVRYDMPLKESIFGERYLRRPPREVLR